MITTSLRYFSLLAKRSFALPQLTTQRIGFYQPSYNFCFSKKHDKGPKDEHEQEEGGKHEHERKQDVKQHHHEHGPGCKHDHGHHHEPHHQHGHDHSHHAAHPHVKLSKLSFEELINLETEESLKYAHMIYEQEEKNLKEIQDEQLHTTKNIEFFKKLEHEITEKERKLEENIKIFEEEAVFSTRRAEKQVEESKSFAVTKIAKELLEVADCIANCKKFALESEHKDRYLELIIQGQQVIRDILKKYDIEEFDPTNQEYDPNYQQSLLQIPTPPGCKEGHVAMTMRTGYKIRGRLLRSARVGVFN